MRGKRKEHSRTGQQNLNNAYYADQRVQSKPQPITTWHLNTRVYIRADVTYTIGAFYVIPKFVQVTRRRLETTALRDPSSSLLPWLVGNREYTFHITICGGRVGEMGRGIRWRVHMVT